MQPATLKDFADYESRVTILSRYVNKTYGQVRVDMVTEPVINQITFEFNIGGKNEGYVYKLSDAIDTYNDIEEFLTEDMTKLKQTLHMLRNRG